MRRRLRASAARRAAGVPDLADFVPDAADLAAVFFEAAAVVAAFLCVVAGVAVAAWAKSACTENASAKARMVKTATTDTTARMILRNFMRDKLQISPAFTL